MKRVSWSIGLLAATALLAPGSAAAQAGERTIPAAHSLLKDILPGKSMGLPANGSVDIVEVGFDGNCTMVVAGPHRFLAAFIDFKKAIIVQGTYTVIIQRGVTVLKQGKAVQAEGASTIGISYFPNEENKMLNVFRYMSQQCHAGGATPFD